VEPFYKSHHNNLKSLEYTEWRKNHLTLEATCYNIKCQVTFVPLCKYTIFICKEPNKFSAHFLPFKMFDDVFVCRTAILPYTGPAMRAYTYMQIMLFYLLRIRHIYEQF